MKKSNIKNWKKKCYTWNIIEKNNGEKNKFIKLLKYFPRNKQHGSINTGKRNVTRETK